MTHVLSVSSAAVPVFQGKPALEPVRLSGSEGLNSLFEYELLLKTPDALNLGASQAADFDLDAFIGREISCAIQLDGSGEFVPGATGASIDHIGAGVRQINAIIADAAFWGEEGRHVQYRLTLRPWLHLATLTSDCKVFQNKTAVEILDELLGDYVYSVDKRLIETYPKRDYQIQYNESDFAFFERLCQEWGINYFFEHSDGKHRLVLIDNMGAYKENTSEAYRQVEYHPPGWKVDAEYIHSFVPQNQLTSGRYTTRDYDYTRPRADLTQTRSDPRPTGHADGEMYRWHDSQSGSHFAQPMAGTANANDPHEEGRLIALLRQQALRTHGARAKASGNLRGMVPGCTFALASHQRQKANGEYLILDTAFLVENVAPDSQIKGAAPARMQQWQVRVDFTAHPVREPLRPQFTQAKPCVPGPQSALVVGPEGQNVWTDELGRIKVQFPWDRIGRKNANSSCWVRVSSAWAGNQLGATHVPRVGQEVIVEFLGGDPDLPICTARVHNQKNLPAWRLPEQHAISGFRSRELIKEAGNGSAGRSNHLVLDDTAEKIQVQFKSDHLSSSFSAGHITRIDDNAGRKDARGEGVELRSDGHGAVRAAKGLLLTTDGRSGAVGGILSRDELVSCLEKALAIAKDLAKAADQCQAGERETSPQQDLADAVDALGHGTGPESEVRGKAPAGQPVLALSGAAGIASATPKDHVQYAGINIDTVAGHNQQHYADRSILQTAGQDIEQVTVRGDIRSIANEGKLIQQARHNSVEITGQKSVTLSSTEEDVIVRARKSITLVLEDGTYLRLANGQVLIGMNGQFKVMSAGRSFTGPNTLPVQMPEFGRVDQAQQIKLHNIASKANAAVQREFHVFKGAGPDSIDKSGADAVAKLNGDGLIDLSGR